MTQRILEQKPQINASGVTIVIKNEQELSNIAESASSFNFTIDPSISIANVTILPISFLDEDNTLLKKSKIITETTTKTFFLKTKRIIGKEAKVTSKDVETVYESDYAKPINSFRSLEELETLKTAAIIGSGVYLAKFMFKATPVIHRGNTVTLQLSGNNLEIKIKAKAQDEGGIGQRIKVTPLVGEKKTMEGEIIDSQTVRIDSMR